MKDSAKLSHSSRIMAKHSFPVSTGAIEVVREGPVRLRVTESNPTQSLIELAVDYEKADVPDRAYAADYCRVIKVDYEFVFVFGKLVPGKGRLRNKVEISFPHRAFGYQFWYTSRDLRKSLHDELKSEPGLNFEFEDTETVQSFRANNAFMAWLGDEGLVDFYYIAPSEVHYARAGKRNKILLDPVLRIVMSSHLLLRCLEHVDNLVSAEPGFAATIEAEMKERVI
jgi:hypothetical protein